MQDRFKFRCFYSDDKKMYYHDFELPKIAKEDEKFATIMQCTGLKDKNGNLIYEGDIVNINTGSRNTSGRGVVEYNQPGCNFLVTGYLENPLGYYPRKNGEFCQRLEKWLCTEIIGNIYESPELLEKNNEQ